VRPDLERFRRLHLGMLVVLLAGAIVLVTVRGFDARGMALIGMIALIVAFRWWQLRRAQRPPE